MTNNRKVFFKELIEKKRNLKGLVTIPLSLLFHFSMIGTLIVYPLINSQGMPEVKNLAVHLMSMPKPSAPGVRAAGKPGPRKKPDGPRKEPREKLRSDMIAPIEIPEDIPDIDLDLGEDSGNDLSVDGGIDGNFLKDWGEPGGTGDGIGPRGDLTLPKAVTRSPKLIRKVKPVYPALALKARRQADVILEAETDIYGKVRRVRIISGDPFLNEAAVKAIRQWIYEPYIINGLPQAVKFTVKINFRLNR